MTRYRLILFWMILAPLALPACAASGHFAIRPESIVTAVSDMGIQILPEQLTLPTDVVAKTSAPRLRVRSMEKSGDHRMLLRIECEDREECLPFFVSLRLSQGNDAQLSASPSPVQPPSGSLKTGNLKTIAVRKGSTATLLLDSDRVHIKLSVICLENGAAGQKIRVAGTDNRQVFMAEVIDSALLKGRL